ncbi:MAG: DUF4834 domain-containing protein [Capnocytophaga sp.]|nr:DUF4834 domain-containing protein [Capnocytophaga sp.]
MIQEASFEDFFSGLFIILLIFIGIAWFIRLVFPFAIQYFLRRTLRKMEERNQNFMQEEINFQQKQNQRPQEKKIVGEYIDFEEIE